MKEHEGATILEEIVLNNDSYSDAFAECTTDLAMSLNEVLERVMDNEAYGADNYEEAFEAYKEELECRF